MKDLMILQKTNSRWHKIMKKKNLKEEHQHKENKNNNKQNNNSKRKLRKNRNCCPPELRIDLLHQLKPNLKIKHKKWRLNQKQHNHLLKYLKIKAKRLKRLQFKKDQLLLLLQRKQPICKFNRRFSLFKKNQVLDQLKLKYQLLLKIHYHLKNNISQYERVLLQHRSNRRSRKLLELDHRLLLIVKDPYLLNLK